MEGHSAHIALPQPHEIPKREREDAMGAYLMMFAAWGVGLPLPLLNLLAAIIYFFTNKKTSRFVSFHAYQSLLKQTQYRFHRITLRLCRSWRTVISRTTRRAGSLSVRPSYQTLGRTLFHAQVATYPIRNPPVAFR